MRLDEALTVCCNEVSARLQVARKMCWVEANYVVGGGQASRILKKGQVE